MVSVGDAWLTAPTLPQQSFLHSNNTQTPPQQSQYQPEQQEQGRTQLVTPSVFQIPEVSLNLTPVTKTESLTIPKGASTVTQKVATVTKKKEKAAVTVASRAPPLAPHSPVATEDKKEAVAGSSSSQKVFLRPATIVTSLLGLHQATGPQESVGRIHEGVHHIPPPPSVVGREESPPDEDELTVETLSSIAAAISTIKEIRRESQLVATSCPPPLATETETITCSSIFYRPSPVTGKFFPPLLQQNPQATYSPSSLPHIIPPAVTSQSPPSSLQTFLPPPQSATPPHSIGCSTTFYLPPPSPVKLKHTPSHLTINSISEPLPTDSQTALTKTGESTETGVATGEANILSITKEILPKILTTTNNQEEKEDSQSPPETPSTEIPVIFINTKSSNQQTETNHRQDLVHQQKQLPKQKQQPLRSTESERQTATSFLSFPSFRYPKINQQNKPTVNSQNPNQYTELITTASPVSITETNLCIKDTKVLVSTTNKKVKTGHKELHTASQNQHKENLPPSQKQISNISSPLSHSNFITIAGENAIILPSSQILSDSSQGVTVPVQVVPVHHQLTQQGGSIASRSNKSRQKVTTVFYDAPVLTSSSNLQTTTPVIRDGSSSSETCSDDDSNHNSAGAPPADGGWAPCEIALEERLLKTSAIWYLPDLHRLGAVHLLQGQPIGCFIVRGSSKPNTLAVTVRLPPNKGPHVEHYLIELHPGVTPLQAHNASGTVPASSSETPDAPTTNTTFEQRDLEGCHQIPSEPRSLANVPAPPSRPSEYPTNGSKSSSHSSGSHNSLASSSSPTYSLEASENRFDSTSALIAHYASCCDELPVQLQLAPLLQLSSTRKQLHSLALLGQEFWRTAGAVSSNSPSGGGVTSPPSEPPPTRVISVTDVCAVTRPADLNLVSFSSFGKSSISASNASLFSPSVQQLHSSDQQRSALIGVDQQRSMEYLTTPQQELQHCLEDSNIPMNGNSSSSAADRSSLHLNLAPLDDILKEPPTFLSFKGSSRSGSQQNTPLTGVNKLQHMSYRVSPPNIPTPTIVHNLHTPTLHTPTLQTPTLHHPPSILHLQPSPLGCLNSGTPTTDMAPLISRNNSMNSPSFINNNLMTTNSFTSPSSTNSNSCNIYPPMPPPRWAKSALSTPNSSGTITTTLTFPVNQVKELPIRISSDSVEGELIITPSSTSSSLVQEEIVEKSTSTSVSLIEKHVATNSHHVSNSSQPIQSFPSNFMESHLLSNSCNSANATNFALFNRHRDNLDLRIRNHGSFMSPQSTPCNPTTPQSTPCTPCNPTTTPLSTPLSEEGGESRAKLRKSHRDRRRHSNHYHDVNVIDNSQCYRSSLADKISDYEDVWSSPPRELDNSSFREPSSPQARRPTRKMSTFKPNATENISKSLGDLSDISQNKSSSLFACDAESIILQDEDAGNRLQELNGNSFDSIPFRNTNSPFYVEPADCLKDAENRARIKKKVSSNKILTRKIANRYSDSNIQWRSRNNRNFIDKMASSNENLNSLSSSVENLVNGINIENDLNAFNALKKMPASSSSKLSNGRNLHMRNSRSKPVIPPRVSTDNLNSVSEENKQLIESANYDPNRPPWRLDASWRYQPCDTSSTSPEDDRRSSAPNSGSPSGDARFPVLESNGEESIIHGEKTIVDLIAEKLPNLPFPNIDTQSIATSCVTKVSEYDNVAFRANGAPTKNGNCYRNSNGNLLHDQSPSTSKNTSAVAGNSPNNNCNNSANSPNNNSNGHLNHNQSSTSFIANQSQSHQHLSMCLSSSVSDSGTEFSEPWDSRKWDTLLHTDEDDGNDSASSSSSSLEPISLSGTPARPQLEECNRRLNNKFHNANNKISKKNNSEVHRHIRKLQQDCDGRDNNEDGGEGGGRGVSESDDDTSSYVAAPYNIASMLYHQQHPDSTVRSKILSPQLLALRHRTDAESGIAIRRYSLQLGQGQHSMFAQNIHQFIKCTLESSEKDPEVVVRNVRQFMSGMKNYLVTSGENCFEDIVKRERANLKATEFLNMDAILEEVLVRLVLRRLWHHITALYVNAYTADHSIETLANNLALARSLSPEKLGIRSGLKPPSGQPMAELRRLLAKMQRVYAPREKLELLLTAISLIYLTLAESPAVPFTGDAEDLVPMLMWLLSHCGFFSAEIEADYMSGLLLTSSACGEARYYLTAFHSAIHSLKNLAPSPESTPGNSLDSVKQDPWQVSECGTLRIVVPDEANGSIVTRSLPVRPTTTTREVCTMLAHKIRVTNPQDYGLYKLVQGMETLLGEAECPQAIRTELTSRGLHCVIAFKRTDAKIAWPIVDQ